MLKKRYLTPFIVEDLKKKMVFVSGPRQVGKTTLSKELVSHYFKHSAYFNWDLRSDRKKVINSEWPPDIDLIILDEIHKYRKWKTFVKGNYDKFKEIYKFIVTGSAKLNIFRRGGDSLQGRYHNYRLHPFSLAEFCEKKNSINPKDSPQIGSQIYQNELETLLNFGGFPEPLLEQDARLLRRWHQEKLERLFREDIREIELIRDLSSLQLLSDLLPERVGSLLSINSLREDLEVSHGALTNWMNILESFYYQFRIYPFTNRSIRSLKKEPKLYLWDWSEVEDQGMRYENLVAAHLLKLVHFLVDHDGYKASLHFLRDKEKREVDFLVAIDNKPWFVCEAKLSDTTPSKHLLYYKNKLNLAHAYQIVMHGKKDFVVDGVRILPAAKFLSSFI